LNPRFWKIWTGLANKNNSQQIPLKKILARILIQNNNKLPKLHNINLRLRGGLKIQTLMSLLPRKERKYIGAHK